MPGDQERYKHLISIGHTYAWDLDWQQAAEQYLEALVEFPESSQACSLRSQHPGNTWWNWPAFGPLRELSQKHRVLFLVIPADVRNRDGSNIAHRPVRKFAR